MVSIKPYQQRMKHDCGQDYKDTKRVLAKIGEKTFTDAGKVYHCASCDTYIFSLRDMIGVSEFNSLEKLNRFLKRNNLEIISDTE